MLKTEVSKISLYNYQEVHKAYSFLSSQSPASG